MFSLASRCVFRPDLLWCYRVIGLSLWIASLLDEVRDNRTVLLLVMGFGGGEGDTRLAYITGTKLLHLGVFDLRPTLPNRVLSDLE